MAVSAVLTDALALNEAALYLPAKETRYREDDQWYHIRKERGAITLLILGIHGRGEQILIWVTTDQGLCHSPLPLPLATPLYHSPLLLPLATPLYHSPLQCRIGACIYTVHNLI